MKNFPKLGKPTRQGYRRSKGYVQQNGRLIQKTFWLGRNAATAVEKIRVIERHAEAKLTQDVQLIWTAEEVASIDEQLAAMDTAQGNIACDNAAPARVRAQVAPIFEPVP